MKSFFVSLLVLPGGIFALIGACLTVSVVASLPQDGVDLAQQNRDEFPEPRNGAGTY